MDCPGEVAVSGGSTVLLLKHFRFLFFIACSCNSSK